MKRILFTISLLAIIPAIVSAQTQTRERLSSEQSGGAESTSVRTRVVGPKASNHADSQKSRVPENNSTQKQSPAPSQPVWGNTSIIIRPEQVSRTPSTPPQKLAVVDDSKTARKLIQPTVFAPLATSPRSTASSRSVVASLIYNVGAGDVLDIRLSNTPARESTLFTVLKNGTVEYPLLNGPISVVGLTTDEIGKLLATEIKVIKSPKVNVSVRDFASHGIVVTGLVDNPGRKTLRREAMPLYAVLAEASLRPEATTLAIVHNGKEGPPLSLKNEQAMATLISSGDVIRIGADHTPNQYVYIGGDLSSPGEKSFRKGMTLTQILLSAGADSTTTKAVKVARRDNNGLLSTSEYNLRLIKEGKAPDPVLEAGDRIEITRVM